LSCGLDSQLSLKISGGQAPFTFTASQLPAGMTLGHNGDLIFVPSCTAAGHTLTAAVSVMDRLGRTSPTVTISFLILAPAANISGAWTGTYTLSGFASSFDCSASADASATFSQSGTSISGTVSRRGDCSFDAVFQGTLSGNTLSGILTQTISGVSYTGCTSGSASDSAIDLFIPDLRAGLTVVGTAGRMSLHR
jgi:hypothetical protein